MLLLPDQSGELIMQYVFMTFYAANWGTITKHIGIYKIRDYYMTFSISALVLARDSHIKPDSEAGGLIWVEGWYQRRYGKFHVMIFYHIFYIDLFQALTFILQKRSLNWQIAKNKSLRELTVQLANIFVSSLVSKICRPMTLETVCKIYPRRWHLNGNSYSTRRIHFS